MNVEQLMAKFEQGDTPTGQDFADLIRLCYNVGYKIVDYDYNFTINANQTDVVVPIDSTLKLENINLYLNGILQSKNSYSQSYADGGLVLTVTPFAAVRQGFVRIKKIEEVIE